MSTVTPMFQQYLELKAAHPDCLLLFRMGDFYEVFYEDAEVAARELELTLTARNKQADDPIPMAGVPYHALDGYLRKLVRAGYRVAIAEQMVDPSTVKGLVPREVTRVVTPGVQLDPEGLDASAPNHLVALVVGRDGTAGLAALDASTGDLRACETADLAGAVRELARLEPVEALLGPGADDESARAVLTERRCVISSAEAEGWRLEEARRELRQVLGVASTEAFDLEPDSPAVRAIGAVLRYARTRSGHDLSHVHRVRTWRVQRFLVLDETTQRNLELLRTMRDGRRKGSLLDLLNKCRTPMGARRLREWLHFPLLEPDAISRRSSAVAALVDSPELREHLRQHLRDVYDMERIGGKVAAKTANARDLSRLRESLAATPTMLAPLARDPVLRNLLPEDVCADVREDLERWLVEDPPIQLTDGGIIREGADPELDRLTRLAEQGRGGIEAMQEREQQQSGIRSLKIKHNKVFGFFIEISRANLHKVPEHYLRKQTLSNCERFITPELKEFEETVLTADTRRKELEFSRFVELRDRVQTHARRIEQVAACLSRLAALASLAVVAEQNGWVRPVVDESQELDIKGGRHPVVEASLTEDRFVPNDVQLDTDERQLIVLTGPNMAGKSTVMRQTAIIVLLAQMGSFVPADSARVGWVDRIFTRVGAADDLARGQSTFMVEMAETATILHNASRRSLVLLDEIGRGTSTYDGLAIAWSVAEDLHDRIGARCIFATHYHELCELEATRKRVYNQSVAVSEWEDRILFLRTLREGGASRSYGIQCARLAGLPRPVLDRARRLLQRFEKHAPKNDKQQLSLFGTAPAPVVEEAPVEPVADPLRELLAKTDPDVLTPRQALDALYRLKELS